MQDLNVRFSTRGRTLLVAVDHMMNFIRLFETLIRKDTRNHGRLQRTLWHLLHPLLELAMVVGEVELLSLCSRQLAAHAVAVTSYGRPCRPHLCPGAGGSEACACAVVVTAVHTLNGHMLVIAVVVVSCSMNLAVVVAGPTG